MPAYFAGLLPVVLSVLDAPLPPAPVVLPVWSRSDELLCVFCLWVVVVLVSPELPVVLSVLVDELLLS